MKNMKKYLLTTKLTKYFRSAGTILMRFTSLDFFKNLYFLDFKLTKIPERLFEGESPDVNFQFILRKIPNPNIKWKIDFFK